MVKKIVDGVETEVNEELKPGEESPASGVKEATEPEPKEDEVKDADGVPYKNRAAEYKRKHEEALEKIRLLEEDKSKSPATPPVEEDEWTKQQRQIARDEYRRERDADDSVRNNLNTIETARPAVKKYRGEIERELSRLNSSLRLNPMVIQEVTNTVLGRHFDEISQKPKEPRKLGQVNDVLAPTPSGDGASKVVLTAEETAFADDREMWDRYTPEEIRERFNKRKEKLKKK